MNITLPPVLTPRNYPGTHQVGGSVGRRDGMDILGGERGVSCACWEANHDSSDLYPEES